MNIIHASAIALIGLPNSLPPEPHKPEKPNILMICVDDLRPELPSFGKGYIKAPNIEKLISEGRLFKRHYVQAPTCGASRFGLLTGLYPKGKYGGNNAIMNFTKANGHHEHQPMPMWFKTHGYTTWSIGKISHYPGGYAGSNWEDRSKEELPGSWTESTMPSGAWKHSQGAMHGTKNGAPRTRGKTPPIEVTDAVDGIAYPDDNITKSGVAKLKELRKSDKPWFLAVGLIKPHLPFTAHTKHLELYKNVEMPKIPNPAKPPKGEPWHGSKEMMSSYSHGGKDPRKDPKYAAEILRHYAACVSYVDDNVGHLMKALEESGQADNTIVVFWSDHGWHLGEKSIWGKHTLYAVSLHSPLVIKTPNQVKPGASTDSVVQTIDIFPTLCELARIDVQKSSDGNSLKQIIQNPDAKGVNKAVSYWGDSISTITPTGHTVKNKKGQLVLKYDLSKDPHEANNLAK